MLPSIPSAALIGALSTAAVGVNAFPSHLDNSLVARAGSSGMACNNSPQLCSKQYNKITYMGVHDSAFLRDQSTGNSVAGNQFFNATDALDAGLRFLQAQVHNKNGTLELCHTDCSLLDAGSLEDYLSKISVWMGGNPNDVVTLLFVNSDNQPVSEFAAAYEQSGLSKYGYQETTSAATGDWPTLQTMIGEDQRLVSFITNINSSTAYPYLRDEFDYVFETAFDVTSIDGFNCTLNRPAKLGSAATALGSNYMGLLNHFKEQTLSGDIEVPDADAIDTVNSPGSSAAGNLGLHLQQCTSQWGVKPSFVLVDFWNVEDPVQAADTANGLTAADITGRTNATTGGGDSSGAGSEVSSPLGRCALLAALAGCLLLV